MARLPVLASEENEPGKQQQGRCQDLDMRYLDGRPGQALHRARPGWKKTGAGAAALADRRRWTDLALLCRPEAKEAISREGQDYPGDSWQR
jgi:hypothetical protein